MANKKINQLVSKTAILSTDLFGIGDATTGQLFKKTIAELQAAIGGAVISVNGLVGTVVLDTDDIQELATPTNKYFTDARARAAISLTVTGNSGASTYSSGTGVLNVPTYTLAGLGGITASFLSGTSGISYNSTTGVISYSGTVYTDSSIRALLSGGTGITYNSSTGAISYSGTVYTDSSVRALISMTTTGNSGASTYNNTTGVINVPDYTLAGLGGISLTSLSGGTGITYNNTTGAISYSGTVYTDASVRALISASGAVSYNNTTGVISLTSGNLTEATSSVLTITGGTGAVLGSGTSIQVKQASTSISGFLSSTDWNTFNNKQATLTNPVTGTGTTNYVAKFTSSSAIGNSNIQDSGTALTFGVASTFSNSLMVNGSTVSTEGLSVQYNQAKTFTTQTAVSRWHSNESTGSQFKLNLFAIGNATSSSRLFSFQTSNEGVANEGIISFQADGGKIGIGTTAPIGFLQVKLSTNNNIAFLPKTVNSIAMSAIETVNDSGSSNTAFAINASEMYLMTQNTTRLTITSAGTLQVKPNTIGTADTAARSIIIGSRPSDSTLASLGFDTGGTYRGNFDFSGSNGNLEYYTYSGSSFVNRFTVTTAGLFGIGTSSPTGLLQLNGSIANSADSSTFTIKQSGTSYNNGIYLERAGERNGYHMYIGGSADALTFRRNYFGTQSDVMSLTRDGDIFLLGTINSRGATDDVTVQNYYRDGTYEFGVQKVSGRGADLFFTSNSNFNIVKRTTYGSVGGNVLFRITDTGNALIGTTSDNGERLYVSGAIRATGTITANSDLTLKKNLLKIENALEKVEQINGYTYEFKEDDSKRHAGVIAQEIQTVLPEIVNKGNDGILGVEYGNISALLIEAIKEQNIKIKNLETLLASK